MLRGVCVALLVACFACVRCTKQPSLLTYHVVAEYPHDGDAFTQGLEFDRVCNDFTKQCFDVFWESTGLHKRSSIRQVDLNTGKVLQQTNLSDKHFGEGLSRLGGFLYQLVWTTPLLLVYSVETLKPVRQLHTPLKDGWGMTADGKHLVISDGTAKLTWFDPETQTVNKSITVTDGGQPVTWLNELEFVDGQVWANVWQTECIARIDVASGRVTHWLLLHGLMHALSHRPQHRKHSMDVLNGIAWDQAGQRLFVTGKLWPRIFEVVPQPHTDMTLQKARQLCWSTDTRRSIGR